MTKNAPGRLRACAKADLPKLLLSVALLVGLAPSARAQTPSDADAAASSATRKFADSPLEQSGFEPSVPLQSDGPEPLRDLSLLGGYRALFNELFASS
jgi:hypothetical protein